MEHGKAHEWYTDKFACRHLIYDNGDILEWNANGAELLAHKFTEVNCTANFSENVQKLKDELESDR